MSIYIVDLIYSYNQFQLSITLQSYFFYLKQNTSVKYNRAVIVLHLNTFLVKSDPQLLLKIRFKLIHKRYSKLMTHKRYSNWPFIIIIIIIIVITCIIIIIIVIIIIIIIIIIGPQTLLKLDPQTLLKIIQN